MKPIALMLLLVVLLASFLAGYLTRALTHSHDTTADAEEFRKAEQALDKLFTIDPQPRPRKQP